VPLSTNINEPLSTYFPPGELSIATEVEQLLPPLSPDPGLWEISVPDIAPADNEVLLEPISDIVHDPTTVISPGNVREGTDEAGSIPAATESLVQVTNPFVVSAPDQSEDVATNTTSDPLKLARLLTDQLQQHHGCCHQCHTQQESEHQNAAYGASWPRTVYGPNLGRWGKSGCS
jgi:hypothetical protein